MAENPEMLRQAADMMAAMPPEQIAAMAGAAPGMNHDMARMAAEQVRGPAGGSRTVTCWRLRLGVVSPESQVCDLKQCWSHQACTHTVVRKRPADGITRMAGKLANFPAIVPHSRLDSLQTTKSNTPPADAQDVP